MAGRAMTELKGSGYIRDTRMQMARGVGELSKRDLLKEIWTACCRSILPRQMTVFKCNEGYVCKSAGYREIEVGKKMKEQKETNTGACGFYGNGTDAIGEIMNISLGHRAGRGLKCFG